MNLGRWFRTISQIPPRQLAARVRFEIMARSLPRLPLALRRSLALGKPIPTPPLRQGYLNSLELPDLPNHFAPPQETYTLTFLNESRELDFPITWNSPDYPRLWQFNLHYFDWVRDVLTSAYQQGKVDEVSLPYSSDEADLTPLAPLPCEGRGEPDSPLSNKAAPFPSPTRGELGRGGEGLGERLTEAYWLNLSQLKHFISDWISANPLGYFDGWHPYTTSLRIVNWTFATRAIPMLAEPEILASLWSQVQYLHRHKEYFAGGNHLLENLRALIVGGLNFNHPSAEEIVRVALGELEQQLAIQVLPDGGHYELSPMYHLIVMSLVAESVACLQSAGWSVPETVSAPLRRMLQFAQGIRLSNGAYPLWNDAAYNIINPLDEVVSWVSQLLGEPSTHPTDALHERLLRATGNTVRLTSPLAPLHLSLTLPYEGREKEQLCDGQESSAPPFPSREGGLGLSAPNSTGATGISPIDLQKPKSTPLTPPLPRGKAVKNPAPSPSQEGLTESLPPDWIETMKNPAPSPYQGEGWGGVPTNLARSPITSPSSNLGGEGSSTSSHFPDSGYYILRNSNGLELAFDCASPCPKELPPHAHADCLTIDLYYKGQPVIVDTGTSQYGSGAIRSYERSTLAHNTVALAKPVGNKFVNQDQSEIWGSFRVGRKAQPFNVKSGNSQGWQWVSAAHNGYSGTPLKAVHQRWVGLGTQEIVILDYLETALSTQYTSTLHFAPGLDLVYCPETEEYSCQLDTTTLYIKLLGMGTDDQVKWLDSDTSQSWYAPEFGRRYPRGLLRIQGLLPPTGKTICILITLDSRPNVTFEWLSRQGKLDFEDGLCLKWQF